MDDHPDYSKHGMGSNQELFLYDADCDSDHLQYDLECYIDGGFHGMDDHSDHSDHCMGSD